MTTKNKLKQKIANMKQKVALFSVSAMTPVLLATPVFADDPFNKIKSGLTKLQAGLVGLIVLVATCITIWIALTQMINNDDPQAKMEAKRRLGFVWGLAVVASLAGVIVTWLVSLFN